MTNIRIGQGYDVHRLVQGRRLILGGVDIPFEKGLEGHSDADVLLHAITDAILGAACLGDIGQHFPPTDMRWKGADSRRLLAHVCGLVAAEGWRIVNIDSTVIAQRPHLSGYIVAIRESIAATVGISAGQVSVKAKTNERLGFEGREEGIVAQAAVLLEAVQD